MIFIHRAHLPGKRAEERLSTKSWRKPGAKDAGLQMHHLKHQHTNDKNQCKEFSSFVTSIHLVIYIGDPCLYGKRLPFQPRHSGRQETIEVAPLIRAGSLRLEAQVSSPTTLPNPPS